MRIDICAKAAAIVPENQAGGPYKEGVYTIIPVRVEEVIFNKDYQGANECSDERIEAGIKNLQEIVVKGNLEVPRGSRLTLEFDLLSLGGVHHWPAERGQGKIIRVEPYAVEVRYERG